MTQQLALNLSLKDDATFANFYDAEKKGVIEHLQACIKKQGELFIYLWGAAGAGCTHLMQACCHFAQDTMLSAAYIPLADYKSLSPQIFEGLEQLQLVCIDDVDNIAGQAEWEEALFHCFNRLRQADVPLIVTAKASPQQLNVQLKDLHSRFNWGLCFQLSVLNDNDKLYVLQLRAKQRGLVLNEEVGRFLLRRHSRSMPALFTSLDALDKASLVAQRKLTIPFVKSILDL